MAAESVGFRRSSVDLFPIGVICGLDPDPELASVCFITIHRTCGVSIRNNTAPTRQLPLTSRFERTEMSGDETFVRQRALVGNSLNDEQRCDDLLDPSLH